MIEEIKSELARLEAEHEIKILLAVESGSRAWGFASADSDWDIRKLRFMKDGICRNCGEREVYKRRDGIYGLEVPISVFSKTFLELYVCAKCGYLEFYVQNEEKLRQIPENFKKVE